MNEKPNYYAIIPGNVRYDPELKDKAKLLYGEITALSNKDGYCFASNSYFAKLYGVSNQTIINMINNLVDKGYVERIIIYKEGTKEIDKRYLKIIDGGTQNILTRGTQKIFTDNNTSNINNTSINNNIYSRDTQDNIPYKDIIDYFNFKTNSNYKHTTNKTREHIRARINEGFTIEDFKEVIDKKVLDWGNDSKMCQYLRPETLFGTKFENYLNQKVDKKITTKDISKKIDFMNFLKEDEND